jgi:hypothetical protein
MEALYMNMPHPTGFGAFAPALQPERLYRTSRKRLAA